MSNTAGQTVWLLTLGWDQDENGAMTMERQSLHTTKDAAVTRVFDLIHGLTHRTPQQTQVTAAVTQDNGAEYADLDVDGEPINYSIVPLVIEKG